MTLTIHGAELGVASAMPTWYDFQWNPIVGCTAISPGCANCEAAWYISKSDHVDLAVPLKNGSARWTGQVLFSPSRMDSPGRIVDPSRFFVASMSDLFHEDVTDAMVDQIVGTAASLEHHTFFVLTKRAERMRNYALDWVRRFQAPLPKNIYFGISVENQTWLDQRLPFLLETPAAVRWINAEPLLGQITLPDGDVKLDWIAAGPEVGPNMRPCDENWVRTLRDQALSRGIPFFLNKATLDGITYAMLPVS